MAKKKISRTLDPPPRKRRPKFVMARPNDDLDAYGWSLKNVRLPSDDKDIPGRPAFHVKVPVQDIKRYGPDVKFLCPEYIELQLDSCPNVTKAINKARDAGWSAEAVNKITDAVVSAFNEKALVDIAQRFYEIASMVAAFYAARAAYRDMYGNDELEETDTPEADDQIEAKTTKSRR